MVIKMSNINLYIGVCSGALLGFFLYGYVGWIIGAIIGFFFSPLFRRRLIPKDVKCDNCEKMFLSRFIRERFCGYDCLKEWWGGTFDITIVN